MGSLDYINSIFRLPWSRAGRCNKALTHHEYGYQCCKRTINGARTAKAVLQSGETSFNIRCSLWSRVWQSNPKIQFPIKLWNRTFVHGKQCGQFIVGQVKSDSTGIASWLIRLIVDQRFEMSKTSLVVLRLHCLFTSIPHLQMQYGYAQRRRIGGVGQLWPFVKIFRCPSATFLTQSKISLPSWHFFDLPFVSALRHKRAKKTVYRFFGFTVTKFAF